MPAWSSVTANLVHFLIGLVVIIDQFGRGIEIEFEEYTVLNHYFIFLDKTIWQLLPPISFNSASSIPTLGMLSAFL